MRRNAAPTECALAVIRAYVNGDFVTSKRTAGRRRSDQPHLPLSVAQTHGPWCAEQSATCCLPFATVMPRFPAWQHEEGVGDDEEIVPKEEVLGLRGL
jgi:hypothetical protein